MGKEFRRNDASAFIIGESCPDWRAAAAAEAVGLGIVPSNKKALGEYPWQRRKSLT